MTPSNVIPFPIHKLAPAVDSPAAQTEPNQLVDLPSNQSLQSTGFTALNYLPKGMTIHLLENGKGVQIIPHRIFEFMVKTTETRVELSVFACLIRYSLGFRRPTCEASNSFIAEWTGLAPTSVRRGLEGLLSKNLIKCIRIGVSFKDSSIYEIPIIKGYLDSNHSSEQSKQNSPDLSSSSHELLNRQEAEYSVQRGQDSANRGCGTLPTGGDKKHNLNQTEESKDTNSSTNSFQNNITAYFSNLKSKKKELRELNHFETLKQSKSLEQISEALSYLTEKGLPGSGERCFAPMAFLVCSIDVVLSYVATEQKKVRQKENETRRFEEKKMKEDQYAEEDRIFSENTRRFNEAFPTEELQRIYITELAKRYPILSANPVALKNLAISEWASKQNQSSN